MNPYSLRVLSSLMRGTERQVEQALMERQAEGNHGFLNYDGAYRALRTNAGTPMLALRALQNWRDDPKVKAWTRSFRQNAYPNLEWCADVVLPRIRHVIATLEGDRQRTGRLLELAGQPYTGGFHMLVEWEDGSERLVYFLGPKWARKRVRHMLVLLQMKAASVYGRTPQSAMIVDIKRREMIELQDLDPHDRDEAISTARWLRAYMRRRQAG